jgi:hypothetical protein
VPAADTNRASFLRALGLRFEHTRVTVTLTNCFCILSHTPAAAAACLRKYPLLINRSKCALGKMSCAFAKAFCNTKICPSTFHWRAGVLNEMMSAGGCEYLGPCAE